MCRPADPLPLAAQRRLRPIGPPPALTRPASRRQIELGAASSLGQRAGMFRLPGHTGLILSRTGKGIAFAQNQIQTELKGALIKNGTLTRTLITPNRNPSPNPA